MKKKPTQPMCVRFNTRELGILRSLAADQSIPLSTYLRSLVMTHPSVKEKVKTK